jgi:hypothetical protein
VILVMRRHRWPLLALAALLATAGSLRAAPPASAEKDAQLLAAKIDYALATRWQADKVQPAATADDAEFLRRASLDIAGRVPAVAEVRRFLKDSSSDKRRRLVEDLLDGPGYPTHFTHVWRALLLPEAESSIELRSLVPGFENWLRKQFEEDAGYDRMVRELLTVPFGRPSANGEVTYSTLGSQQSPAAYYVAKEGKPENLAASAARLFLGARLECAQCHDHPFARWKREQFWGLAAFFAGLRKPAEGPYVGVQELLDRRELAIPGTERVVQASFLDGKEPQWKYKVGPRVTLADWMTAADNPFFAKAAVNRLWAHFFGTGLVEPIDDLSEANKPSHPELLNELARQFAAHGFDQKFLIRAITSSRAYNLTSAATHPSQNDPRQFARMAVKGLTPEQLFDSLARATGYRDPTPASQRLYDFNSKRAVFLSKFTTQDRATEHHTSIPQALALMNSGLIGDVTSLDRSETLGAVVEAPFLDTAGKVETLFLAALGRRPRAEEAERMIKYVRGGGAAKSQKKALADVFWALLNSPEFILNH